MPPKKKISEADEEANSHLTDEEFGDEEEREKEQQKNEFLSEGAYGGQKELNLEKLVSLPTWREMILDLVESEKLDPWNIDMAEVTDKYIQRVRKMQTLDLRVPANLILAAAILLKFKSDALKFEEQEQVAEDNVFIDEGAAGDVEEVPVLELRTRIPPKTKVTLEELMTAMEEVFEDQRKREMKLLDAVPESGSPLQINVPKYDMEDRMKEMLTRIEETTDSEGLVLFSSLLTEKTSEQLIMTLLPLLHLAQNNKISLKQEKMFGEIIIRLLSLKNDDINGSETKEAAE
ncbi:Segregation and condensation protein A [Candidatus Gugararchaeum adminiculabundum]|nr:Segregation and condensation protein A [Candidatus Gugararchaeum adminiculabundum]